MKGQGKVKRRPEVGKEWSKSNGRDDEKPATATGPGKGATDQWTGGISLVKPTSSQGSLPRARDIHHGHIELQNPHTTRQTAVNKATDTTDPNATGAGPAVPVGTMNQPRHESDKDLKGEKGERDERASGDVAPSSNAENAIPNSTPPPPYPDELTTPPPSMPLKGEDEGVKSSGGEKGDRDERIPTQMNDDHPRACRSRGRWLVDREVKGSRDDKEGQETRGNEAGDLPPEPSAPPPPSSPSRPEQHHDDNDDLKSNTMATRTRVDAVHDPGGQTVEPEDKPPSVQLEGEKNKVTSLNVKVNNVEMDNDHTKVDNDKLKLPQDPVGMTDGNERRPNEPTEPPDKKEGKRGVDGESTVESTVERVVVK
ncbi:hypothetical protein BDN67DRAFT_983801 [Paxillus ammoniavirescens]|nr:hypothetical protein BDN67DRAFT_983801 [Paxillus ammoniavirescens]